MRPVEERADPVAVGEAVHADPGGGEVLPVEAQTRQREGPAGIEGRQPPPRIGTGRGVDQPLVEEPVDRLGAGLFGGDRVQGLPRDGEQAVVQLGLRRRGAGDAPGIRVEVERAQHVGEARVGAAAIDEDLLARQGRGEDRLVHRQAGAEQDVGAVILPAHLLLALLLVELEEAGPLRALEEAVEGIERILVEVDAEIPNLDAEEAFEETAQHLFGAGDVAAGDGADLGGSGGGGSGGSVDHGRRVSCGCPVAGRMMVLAPTTVPARWRS